MMSRTEIDRHGNPVYDGTLPDDDDYFEANPAEDESNDDDDSDISVPTTVASVGDQPTAGSILAMQEYHNQFFTKLLMLGAFGIIAAIVTVGVNGFAREQGTRAYQQQADDYSNRIMDISKINVHDYIEKLNGLAVSFSFDAMASNSSWPFVVIHDFEARAYHFKHLHQVSFMETAMKVTVDQLEKWENFSISSNMEWISESNVGSSTPTDSTNITPYVYRIFKNGTKYQDNVGADIYAPIWQSSVANIERINYNSFDHSAYSKAFNRIMAGESSVIIGRPFESTLDSSSTTTTTKILESMIAIPIHDSVNSDSEVVAILSTTVSWNLFFEQVLQEEVAANILLEDSCGPLYQFQIDGEAVDYEGPLLVDLPKNEFMRRSSGWLDVNMTSGCSLELIIYPSDEFLESTEDTGAWGYTLVVAVTFLSSLVLFTLYDYFLTRRRRAAVTKIRNPKIPVKSTRFADTVLNVDDLSDRTSPLQRSRHGTNNLVGKPVADLHPNATLLFADIVSFTAWSSVKEPTQVFTFLETLYNAFDKIAKFHKIFKVETTGDCYVAACGLPEPSDDHATSIAKFAVEALGQFKKVVKALEIMLGPDTGDLTIKIGIHSGPVTAGILRGEKSRFQLFGETVNMTSKIGSTGEPNRIHVSPEAAELIKEGGNSDWLIPRKDRVRLKGKGEVKTYWLVNPYMSSNDSQADATCRSGSNEAGSLAGFRVSVANLSDYLDSASADAIDEKKERLINWSVDLLLSLLKRVVAMRESEEMVKEKLEFEEILKEFDDHDLGSRTMNNIDGVRGGGGSNREPKIMVHPGMTVLDEVKEIITLPRKAAKYQQNPNNVQLGDAVIEQLTKYVRDIANMYNANPFHSFEHASHVCQSLTKLLSRVVKSDEIDYDKMSYKKKAATSKLHKFTYGITSDPITQFACAFSSLIHDLDHPGVPNAVLVAEETEVAKMYRNKSVAEQNSVDLAWGLLMEPGFKNLRRCIYTTQGELDRFRQLVVNSVMATDIVDKELGALRKNRWEKAFNKELATAGEENDRDSVNRKATIVIEHLIQAADVAHTMQHWHVYLKWNERFFHECYQSFLSGRVEKDPSEGWYKGEIGFFDFYIIPLAKKLENCGVFGVSSDECLQYAKANRTEWERKGESIVAKYLSVYNTDDLDAEVGQKEKVSTMRDYDSSHSIVDIGMDFESPKKPSGIVCEEVSPTASLEDSGDAPPTKRSLRMLRDEEGL